MPSTRKEKLVRKSKGNTATEEAMQMEASDSVVVRQTWIYAKWLDNWTQQSSTKYRPQTSN